MIFGGYYEKLHNFAGGKTWYRILTENSGKYLDEKIVKICQNNIKTRNSNIAKKLSKFEITEITSKKFAQTSDGFHGTFVVEINKGKKIITINTIYAGVHNIQMFHTRTLIKIS